MHLVSRGASQPNHSYSNNDGRPGGGRPVVVDPRLTVVDERTLTTVRSPKPDAVLPSDGKHRVVWTEQVVADQAKNVRGSERNETRKEVMTGLNGDSEVIWVVLMETLRVTALLPTCAKPFAATSSAATSSSATSSYAKSSAASPFATTLFATTSFAATPSAATSSAANPFVTKPFAATSSSAASSAAVMASAAKRASAAKSSTTAMSSTAFPDAGVAPSSDKRKDVSGGQSESTMTLMHAKTGKKSGTKIRGRALAPASPYLVSSEGYDQWKKMMEEWGQWKKMMEEWGVVIALRSYGCGATTFVGTGCNHNGRGSPGLRKPTGLLWDPGIDGCKSEGVGGCTRQRKLTWTEVEAGGGGRKVNNLCGNWAQPQHERFSRWSLIASKIPRKTNKHCRRRWQACMNASGNKGVWTAEEDAKLLEVCELAP
ncbi:hypothetical protein CBR_g17110 [Chara braunii]|uniref:Uncharacterized protein n=1 Tax=Chara braunii TaxID=69332 RepID=A0A388KUN2_CHABU|nr:hypothetical protein CBR_g17110 [Chara braunii]|eukprot:GBG73770.1 hypothetical protein CBR_g17110 [Chara braunii]